MQLTEQQINYCMECGVCTGSCPVSYEWEHFSPRQMIRRSLDKETPLSLTREVWACLTCARCSERCPVGIDFPEFIRSYRKEARDRDNPPRESHHGILQTISRLQQGSIVPVRQDDSLATYAPKLQKKDGEIDWHKSAWEVHNHIRAMFPWPGAFTILDPEGSKPVRLLIFPGQVGEDLQEPVRPGKLVKITEDALAFACKDRLYHTPCVQPAGRKKMDAKAFKCGYLAQCS